MTKKSPKEKKGVKGGVSWTLLIEFNGLCAAELVKPPKGEEKPEMIIHFVADAMHNPMLAVRDRDVVSACDCRPDYKVLVRSQATTKSAEVKPCPDDDDTSIPTTVSLWLPLRGTHQEILGRQNWMLKVDTKPAEMKDGKPKNPCSLRWLPDLGKILDAKECNPLQDFAQFRLTQGQVLPGRLDFNREWQIKAGKFDETRPLAVTIIYKVVIKDATSVDLDLHPGILTVGPPALNSKKHRNAKQEEHPYTVEMTYSSLPVSTLADHQPLKTDRRRGQKDKHEDEQHPSTQHFNEFNRLVGKNTRVIIKEVENKTLAGFTTVEDPIHCFDALVVP